MSLQNNMSFGRSHYLGLCRGVLFLLVLMIPFAIGAAACQPTRPNFTGAVAPWVAR